MATEALLALGGNLGDTVMRFAAALNRLARHEAVTLTDISSVYRTPPWGKLDQPEFLNMAARIATTLPADALLALCLDIERENGRERGERWGPRTLDIDILTYGDETIDRPGLQLPHPRIAQRAFVLAPLAEIAPGHIIGGQNVAAIWKALESGEIKRDVAASERLQALFGDENVNHTSGPDS